MLELNHWQLRYFRISRFTDFVIRLLGFRGDARGFSRRRVGVRDLRTGERSTGRSRLPGKGRSDARPPTLPLPPLDSLPAGGAGGVAGPRCGAAAASGFWSYKNGLPSNLDRAHL